MILFVSGRVLAVDIKQISVNNLVHHSVHESRLE